MRSKPLIDSNFSFAFVNRVTMTVILLCQWYQRPKQFSRVVTNCLIPGALVTALVTGYFFYFYHWDSGQFYYGAHTVSETFGSIIKSSPFQTRFDFLKPTIFPLVGITGLAWLLYLFF